MSSVASQGDRARECEVLRVLIPVLNDWDSVQLVLERLASACRDAVVTLDVLLIDDGSQQCEPADLVRQPDGTIHRVCILRLRRNLGHQRAICVGLAWLAAQEDGRNVLVMDGDGEDDPGDVPRLLDQFRRWNGTQLVFARRARRSEGPIFSVFYRLYKTLHRLLTGIPVEVGNFSIIPSSAVDTLSVTAECWNHYAAAVIAARLPRQFVDTQRGHRLHGVSRMNFLALVLHGLSAISVFADRLGVRMLIIMAIVSAALVTGLTAVIAIRFLTDMAIPGWATTATGLLLLLLAQTVLLAAGFTFMILSSRSGSGFLPRRDYALFVKSVDEVFQSA